MYAFHHDNYFIGIWYLEIHPLLSKFGRGGNLSGIVSRPLNGPADHWQLMTRLRQYVDDQIHDSKDERKLMSGKFVGTEAEAEARMRGLFENLAVPFGGKIQFHAFRCDGEKVADILVKNPPPFLSAKIMDKEEFKKRYGDLPDNLSR
jgi:hypothetical protein